MHRMSRLTLRLAVACAAATTAGVASAADLAGDYHGTKLDVQLFAAGDGFAGTASTPAGQMFNLSGHAGEEGVLRGSFVVGARSFPFTATVSGDHLKFETGGTTYELDRVAAPAAPATSPATVPTPFNTDVYSSTMPPGWSGEYTQHGSSFTGPNKAQVLLDTLIPFQPPAAPAGAAPDPSKGPILAFTDPATALAAFAEQMTKHERAAGRPGAEFGPVLANHPLRPTHANGRAALLDYLRRKDGGPLKRVVARVECVPGLSADTMWYMEMTELSAPADSFDAVASTMADVLRSVRPIEDKLHQRFAQETREQSPAGTDPAARFAAAERTYEAERHARATRMLPFEKFYPSWAGHGFGGAATPADFAELEPTTAAGH
jgi:hypothetical protein